MFYDIRSSPGFEVPEVVKLMEHRHREVEQCNMLLLLLLVRRGRRGRGAIQHAPPSAFEKCVGGWGEGMGVRGRGKKERLEREGELAPDVKEYLILSLQASLEFNLPPDVMKATLETAKLTKIR